MISIIISKASRNARFQEVIQNRLLRSALDLLLRIPDPDARVRDPTVTVHRLVKNAELALLINDCVAVSEGGSVVFRGAADDRLADLFERFLRGFYKKEAHGHRVGHPRIAWADASGSESDMKKLPSMQTDIVLQNSNRRIVVEANCQVSPGGRGSWRQPPATPLPRARVR